MKSKLEHAAQEVAMFCRLNMYSKRDIPIRASEMGVLIFVHKSHMPVTPLMISEFLGISKPSVSSLIQGLIKNRYLLKTPSQEDKRSYTLDITIEGKSLVENTYDEYLKSIQLIKDQMNEEDFLRLIGLLEQANQILKEKSK